MPEDINNLTPIPEDRPDRPETTTPDQATPLYPQPGRGGMDLIRNKEFYTTSISRGNKAEGRRAFEWDPEDIRNILDKMKANNDSEKLRLDEISTLVEELKKKPPGVVKGFLDRIGWLMSQKDEEKPPTDRT